MEKLSNFEALKVAKFLQLRDCSSLQFKASFLLIEENNLQLRIMQDVKNRWWMDTYVCLFDNLKFDQSALPLNHKNN